MEYDPGRAAALQDVSHEQVLELRPPARSRATEVAAVRRSECDLDLMRASMLRMEQAEACGDIEALVRDDLAIHKALLRSADNAFLPGLAHEMGYLLHAVGDKRFASRTSRRRVIEHHQAVFEAVAQGDSVAAGRAMESGT
jgi:GntR family transcriptional regulator, transcriptional repressor for pyruvate dehydrogenase complex